MGEKDRKGEGKREGGGGGKEKRWEKKVRGVQEKMEGKKTTTRGK